MCLWNLFSVFLLYGCNKKTEHVTPVVNDEKGVVNEITSTETREDYEESAYKKLDALGYQSEDIMKFNVNYNLKVKVLSMIMNYW